MVKSLLPWAVDGSQPSYRFQSVCLSSRPFLGSRPLVWPKFGGEVAFESQFLLSNLLKFHTLQIP